MNVMLLSVVVAFSSPSDLIEAAPLAVRVEVQANPVAAAEVNRTVRGKGATKAEAKSDAEHWAKKASGGAKFTNVGESYRQEGDKWICTMMIFYIG